jgi:hypothetical protein
MTTEAQIQDAIRLALGQDPDLVLWRNNVGVAEHWDTRSSTPSRLRYGLGKGSSDLIGMVRPSGRLVALEVKRPGQTPTPEQVRFLKLVRSFGGFGAVVTSVQEAQTAVQQAKGAV